MSSPSEIMQLWHARLLGDPSCAERVRGPLRLTLEGDGGGSWILQGGSSPSVLESTPDREVRCTVTLSALDFMALFRRELNPQIAFLTGRIVVDGDFEQALSLAPLME